MNIIEAVRSLIENFPKISEITGSVHIDLPDDQPDSYGLSSIGDTLISEDVLGNQTRRHGFMLYSTFSSANDFERLQNTSALTELALWLEQGKGSSVETVIDGKTYSGTITNILAANGMLYDIPQDSELCGVKYQLQITADYTVEMEE